MILTLSFQGLDYEVEEVVFIGNSISSIEVKEELINLIEEKDRVKVKLPLKNVLKDYLYLKGILDL